MRAAVCLVAFVFLRLTKGKFTENPPNGNRLEFYPLTLRWQHTFINIRGCTWVFSRPQSSVNEYVVMYGTLEGLGTKNFEWELTDISSPCSGGIQKKMSAIADAGFYEFRIVADEKSFISDYVEVGIIRQTERSIKVMSIGDSQDHELIPGKDFNRTLEINNSTSVSISLHDNYPDKTCTKIQMINQDNSIKAMNVCRKTFAVKYDVNITSIHIAVEVDLVDFSPLVFTIMTQQLHKGRQSANTPETSSKSRSLKISLTIGIICIGVVLAVLAVVLIRYFKKKHENQTGEKEDNNIQLEEGQDLLENNAYVHTEKKSLHSSESLHTQQEDRLDGDNNHMHVRESSGSICSNHHDVPDYQTLKYKDQTGSKGSILHQFNKPVSVVCTSDQIIVADSVNHRVKSYNNNLKPQFVTGKNESIQVEFSVPFGLAVGVKGEIYVSDSNNHRIVVLSSTGDYLMEFGTEGTGDNQLKSPKGIYISDGLLYIADRDNYRVKVVELDGTFVHHIGAKASTGTHGQFENVPINVAVMSPGDGRVLVNEMNKPQLHVYTRTGEYRGLFPPSVPTDLVTAVPCGITVDPYDNVLITYKTSKLAVYDKTGNLITIKQPEGKLKEQSVRPVGLAVNTKECFIVVTDTYNHCLHKFIFNYK